MTMLLVEKWDREEEKLRPSEDYLTTLRAIRVM
jgi:hypothetical protein